jgi:hypothetical protein
MNRFIGFILLIVFLLVTQISYGQEELTPLNRNPNLKQKHSSSKRSQSRSENESLELPFFDDFSTYTGLPDPEKWEDKYVYVNQHFGISPPSIGVATFDGLNPWGRRYGNADLGGMILDTLTSCPIDLEGLNENDNIFLSFFYQSQGFGDVPEDADSLVLEFLADTTDAGLENEGWIRVFSVQGAELSSFDYQVIKLENPSDSINYFHKNFKFRFMNYGNPRGNLDHWHIDYVLLDRNRSFEDRSFNDVAVYERAKPFISRYYELPFNQFKFNPTIFNASSYFVYAKNLSDEIKNSSYGYRLTYLNENRIIADNFGQVAFNFRPETFEEIEEPYTAPIFNFQGDSAVFLFETAIIASDGFTGNDTSKLKLTFANYYAYDDGTAETGYYIPNASEAQFAYQFNALVQDTLIGVAIYFNESEDDVSNNTFNLKVWDNIGRVGTPISVQNPENLRYELLGLNPVYQNSRNGFTYYYFDKKIPVLGDFYVGWEQNGSYRINVGFDLNYPFWSGNSSNPFQFYNFNGTWLPSSLPGSVMLRPILTREIFYPPASIKQSNTEQIRIFPNPAQDFVNVEMPKNSDYEISIINGKGQEVYKNKSNGNITISTKELMNGIYVLRVINLVDSATFINKLLINK